MTIEAILAMPHHMLENAVVPALRRATVGLNSTKEMDDIVAVDATTRPLVTDRRDQMNSDPIECAKAKGKCTNIRVLAFHVVIPSWESAEPDVRRE
jgi:hypothetical protein